MNIHRCQCLSKQAVHARCVCVCWGCMCLKFLYIIYEFHTELPIFHSRGCSQTDGTHRHMHTHVVHSHLWYTHRLVMKLLLLVIYWKCLVIVAWSGHFYISRVSFLEIAVTHDWPVLLLFTLLHKTPPYPHNLQVTLVAVGFLYFLAS